MARAPKRTSKRARIEAPFYASNGRYYEPGVREFPVGETLPSDAVEVDENTPLTADGDQDFDETLTASQLARPTAGEMREAKARIAELEAQLTAQEPSSEDAIEDAIRGLDPDDKTLWTSDGEPKVVAVEAVLGRDITAEERDAAWAAVSEE